MNEAVRRATRASRRATAARRKAQGFLNRELSWLDFDRRVLGVAEDESVPLLERVKLCAIVSRNLDEFFAVRVAGLRGQVASRVSRRSPDGRTPAVTLTDIRAKVLELKDAQAALWLDGLKPALAEAGIRVAAVDECAPRELRALKKRFTREIEPLLTPIAVGPTAPFPYLPSLALNVGLLARANGKNERRFVRVNVPDDLPRFLEVGPKGTYVPLEDAIVYFLPEVIGPSVEAHGIFRITRDADLTLDDDVDDLIEAIEDQLSRRRFGEVVRLELASPWPPELLDTLSRELGIDESRVYESPAPLGLAALSELAELDRPELKDSAWKPVTRRPFPARKPAELLSQIRRRDILVHHPYDAFDSTVEAFLAATRDPKVAALKATVYRTGNPSATLESLVETAEEGKQAVCLVELKARFDERRNIEWSRALERAGVDVVFGVPELKVHAKLAMLVRREQGQQRRYVHIGTGNYHSSNASIYEDLGLFTADEEIGTDVADVFNAVTGQGTPVGFRKLLVGPWFLREGILHEIARTAHAAEEGEHSAIRIKVNGLADPETVEALYAASRAGVQVEIVSRGICTLRPGVPGLSENIAVRSVLGRFLEHSRVLSFQTGDRVAMWIGSADLMPRNLDRRIEVLVPVEDSRLRADVTAVLDALAADTRFAWELGRDGTWSRVRPEPGTAPRSAQEVLMTRAAKRAKKHGRRA
jgi:polyphosphate kinase